MNAKERTDLLIQLYSPYKKRKQESLYRALLGFETEEPNRKRSISSRAMDSYRVLSSDLNFLTGMLTVMPFLQSPRTIQFQDEGEKLLREANDLIHKFFGQKQTSVNTVRKMRIYGEKIVRLRDKIKKEMSRKKAS
jgi:hypothetical protein